MITHHYSFYDIITHHFSCYDMVISHHVNPSGASEKEQGKEGEGEGKKGDGNQPRAQGQGLASGQARGLGLGLASGQGLTPDHCTVSWKHLACPITPPYQPILWTHSHQPSLPRFPWRCMDLQGRLNALCTRMWNSQPSLTPSQRECSGNSSHARLWFYDT